MKIDDKDRRIIGLLMDNARMSYRQIAKNLGMSVATIMKRVRNLEKEKTIAGYTAIIDYENLGYDVDVIISVKIAKGRFLEVWKKFITGDDVMAVYDTTGEFDAVLIAKFKNRRSLDSYLKKVQGYDFVERTHTVLILNTVKNRQISVA